MSDPSDAHSIRVRLPVWVVGHHERGLNELLEGRRPDGVVATPIFTDQGVAQRFLEQNPKPNHVLIPIADENRLLGLFRALEKRALTHVVFVAGSGTGEPTIPVAVFRTMLQRAVDEAEHSGA